MKPSTIAKSIMGAYAGMSSSYMAMGFGWHWSLAITTACVIGVVFGVLIEVAKGGFDR